MYLTAEQIQQTCGFLLCNDSNTFIYYCAKCRCEFYSGAELEQHIVFDHHDEKKYVDGIFVDDGILLDTTTTTISEIVPFVPLVETEIIPSAAPLPSDQIINSEEVSVSSKQKPTPIEDGSSPEVPYEKQNKAIDQQCSFYCDMCPDITFRSLKTIKMHIKRHAMNTLRKKCSICPIRPRNMDKHMRVTHNEARPYKCDVCNASFKHNLGRVISFFL